MINQKENNFDDINPKPPEVIPHELEIEKINNGLKITMEKVNMSNLSIKETKDVVVFLCKATNAVLESINDDGKITISDVFKFGGAATALFPALSGINQVPKELADLDPIETDELIQLVKDELELDTDVKAVVEKALKIASQIKELIDLIGQLKAA